MKLVHYYTASHGQAQLGIELSDGILNIEKTSRYFQDQTTYTMEKLMKDPKLLKPLAKLVEQFKATKGTPEALLEQRDQLYYLPVIQHPEKIICVGMNYLDYIKEVDGEIPLKPVLYNKYNNALAGHNQEIPLPSVARKVDYSAELVVVIGKEAFNISKEQALDHVFGYTVGNDLSDRSIQTNTSQWMLGKTLDYFAPVGPSIATKDEISDLKNLSVTLTVNNEVRQQGNTKDMIFDVPYIISFLSRHLTLKPGDLIFTGTPKGVIYSQDKVDQHWLTQNDLLEASISGIGTLINQIK
ncbi:fumarylacetoacetate hydrolase family protein [Marinilactibacillus kalidii]|uniref:fumarylacetoacetate hydrolase family protein n=1 Tax=Marinilactibacillus kalidii TaxID=2820274 RepID=UPI001ABE729C|nr:fumarylacetoacetate hydrolase family protein [Marinilactibacillus kalidii]